MPTRTARASSRPALSLSVSLSLTLGLTLGLPLLAACQSSTATSSTGAASPGDLQFATNASRIIRFDQEECTLAQAHATNPEVRALAAQLLDEANAFQARLAPAAARAGITLPDTLDDTRRVRIGHMNLQNGLDFDRTFVSDQIISHQDAVDMVEAMPATSHSALGQLAQRGNALIRTNLQKLLDLQRRL